MLNLKEMAASVEGKVPPNMRDSYTLRIKEAGWKTSQASGNTMIVWECEIINPVSKSFGGTTYALDGLDVTYYLVLSKKSYPDVKAALERLQLPELPDTLDQENLPDVSSHRGVVFAALLDSRERIATKKKEDGSGYEPILGPDGKKVSQGWEIICNVRDIFYLATAETNRPY